MGEQSPQLSVLKIPLGQALTIYIAGMVALQSEEMQKQYLLEY
jgi:hypothetical protein